MEILEGRCRTVFFISCLFLLFFLGRERDFAKIEVSWGKWEVVSREVWEDFLAFEQGKQF